jgi:hypothetical protein
LGSAVDRIGQLADDKIAPSEQEHDDPRSILHNPQLGYYLHVPLRTEMMESVADAIEQVLNEHECGLAHLLKILRNQGLQLMARGFHHSFHLLRRKKEREQELVLVLVGDGQEVANRPSPAVVRERK